jgi:hypothetical protein
MSIADSVAKALKEIAERNLASVEVGFLEEATYPDGTPVAAVAYWNEYGSSGPPRPFFRQMIEKEKATWGPKLAAAYKHTDGDGEKALRIVGDNIQGALIQSINDLTSPPLAPSTIAAKGFDKPLIDTSHMVNSTGVRVVKGKP